tara:strand:+ start:2327 stop:3289 length:963 start_codon:yes stop_codon:yes gene_type:complete
VTRSWISDTPDEIEHPPIPLGLNKMAVPRAAIVLSVITGIGLLFSSVWVGISAIGFLDEIDTVFGTTDTDLLNEDGRWLWEVGLLFDTCSPREDNWEWPQSLSEQEGVFLLPGEVRCDWQHQGTGDSASVVVHNRANQTLNLVLEIAGGGVVFASNNEPYLIVNDLAGNDSSVMEVNLIEEISEREISITATHISNLEAQVRLDVNIFLGSETRDVHIQDGEPFAVQYTVWDADSGEELDSGDWSDSAGEGCNWSIEGFCWSAIGLDIDNDRGLIPGINTGTTHTTLLPPDIAYGNSDGHELQETWLRFELALRSAPISE